VSDRPATEPDASAVRRPVNLRDKGRFEVADVSVHTSDCCNAVLAGTADIQTRSIADRGLAEISEKSNLTFDPMTLKTYSLCRLVLCASLRQFV